MESFLIHRGIRHNVDVSRAGEGWRVGLPRRSEFTCRLSIGPGALDWYAIIREAESGREAFTDWNDYMGYDNSPLPDLIVRKQKDIDSFVDRWLSATEVRIVVDKHLLGLIKRRRAQWRQDGEWYTVILGEPGAETD